MEINGNYRQSECHINAGEELVTLLNDNDDSNDHSTMNMADETLNQVMTANGQTINHRTAKSLNNVNNAHQHQDDTHTVVMTGDRNGDDSRSTHVPFHCHGDKRAQPDKVARNQLIIVCILCFLFMIGESIGGYLSNSLALFTDVLHLASDLFGFVISLLAIYLSAKPASKKMSFGYHRAEVLGALFSVFVIWLVSGILCYIAVERIIEEHYKNVRADEMLVTAGLGVVFNIVMGIVLQSDKCCKSAMSRSTFGHNHGGGHGHSHGGHGHSHGGHSQNSSQDTSLLPFDDDSEEDPHDGHEAPPKRHKNINVRAAFIHVIGDIIQSLGVFTAALIIKCTSDERFRLADPICTFLFSIIVLFTTVSVLRDTLRVILEGVPKELTYFDILTDLESIEGVETAHGLHLWSLTIDKNAIAVHLAIGEDADFDRVLSLASKRLQKRHQFYHSTIQVERYHHEVMSSCSRCQEGPKGS